MRITVLALSVLIAAPAWAQDAAGPIQGLLGERGLFDVARTEAAIAQRHTKAALRETDLAEMKSQVAAAVHAIDPGLVARGPGLGTGLRPALQATADRLLAAQLAQSAPEADAALRATAASVAAQTALMRTDDALREARDALAAQSTSQAIPSLVRLDDLLTRITQGQDTDGNGEITWNQGEGGLQQAWSFTREMAIAEGLEVAERR